MPWSLLVATRLCYEFLFWRDCGAHGVLGNLQGVAEAWKSLTTYQVMSPQGWFIVVDDPNF